MFFNSWAKPPAPFALSVTRHWHIIALSVTEHWHPVSLKCNKAPWCYKTPAPCFTNCYKAPCSTECNKAPAPCYTWVIQGGSALIHLIDTRRRRLFILGATPRQRLDTLSAEGAKGLGQKLIALQLLNVLQIWTKNWITLKSWRTFKSWWTFNFLLKQSVQHPKVEEHSTFFPSWI